MRILLIEDNVKIAESVRTMLERQKFSVKIAADGDAGLEALLEDTFDAAVVDLVLPARDGFSICRAAREEGIQTPLLILTARDAVEDRVRGLDAGADDYLVKPFVEAELAARLRALLRRRALPIRKEAVVGDLTVDPAARCAVSRGRTIDLAATEYRVLEYLAFNAEMALSRGQIIDRVWGDDFDGHSNIVDVYVSAIRKKLTRAGVKAQIATVWGIGYKLTASSRA
jgi:DNA-binding response OmpR family regulator